jgi:aspartate racemase
MSWESTVTYYKTVNEAVKEKLGGFHSAKVALYSVDFQEIEVLQHADRWDEAGRVLAEDAARIEAAGADFLVLCTNTMHLVAPQIEDRIEIPLLHIADATAEEIKKAGIARIGLLGTRFTMEQDFYRGRLTDRHGLDVVIPDDAGRETVHRVIYDELCLGKILPESRSRFVEVISELERRGAEGVILGCTEIALLVGPEDSPIRVFDTTTIHAQKAVEWALSESPWSESP